MRRALRDNMVRVLSVIARPALRAIYNAYESENPTFQFEGIVVVGNAEFSDRVRHSMRQLEKADCHGYHLVHQYLKSIVATEKAIGLGYLIGARFEPVSAEGYIESDTARFAACLVRYAVYRRLLTGYNVCVWRNRYARNVALKRELHSMRLLNCRPVDMERQIAFIRKVEGKTGVKL